MSQYSITERADMLEQFIINGKSVTGAARAIRSQWSTRTAPSPNTFRRVYENFRRFGSLFAPKERTATARSPQIVANVQQIVEEASTSGRNLSSRRVAAQVGVSHTTAWKILRKDLGLKPYHLRLIHKLNEDDFDRRVEFSELILEKLRIDPELSNRIIWSDEAVFTLAETVNRHNCVYWESENSGHFVEIDSLGAEKVMVWAGVWSGGRIGPFFFDSSVNGENYRRMLENEVIPRLAEMRDDYRNYFIFQQDGAPAHYARSVRNLLDETFTEWIGRRGPIEWPARSPDLTVADFFLWGYLKDQVFARGPETIDELKAIITEEFNRIPQEMIAKACRSVSTRLELCIDIDGQQIKLHED
jgi:transcriptional regulator with XRE-family HTH domain